MKNYNAVIIGFGKAGKTLAAELAHHGQKVALIEKSDRMYGGTCINVGCIPSKSLINNAAVARNTPPSIWNKKSEFFAQAVAEKNELTAALRQKNYDKLVSAQVEIYNGTARFINDNSIEVTSNGKSQILTAEQIFINTGAVSFIPPIKGINHPAVYTSESLMSLEKLPQTLVIIGGGYIGMEFASMYSGFGSKVIILQDLPSFLPREDEDIAAEILKDLEAQGIEFRFGVKVEELADNKGQPQIKYTDEDGELQQIDADAVLVATGRRPNVKELDIDKAHIRLTKSGAVETDETLQTSNPNVWAMGDVTGGLQFTYISLDDYRIVKSQLLEDKKYTLKKRKNVPYSVFLATPYSRIGLNEKEALEKGYNIKIAKLPVAAIPKAKVLKQDTGLMKAVINADNNQILGAMLFCAESHELINTVKLAMDLNAPYQTLRDNIYTHPTMNEAFNDLFNNIN